MQGPTNLMVTLVEKDNADAKPFSAHPVDARDHLKSGKYEVVNGGHLVSTGRPAVSIAQAGTPVEVKVDENTSIAGVGDDTQEPA